MKKTISLKRVLTFNSLLVAVLPILVFGTIAVSLLERHLSDEVEQQNLIVARDISEETGNFLAESIRDLDLVGQVLENSRIVKPGGAEHFLNQTVVGLEAFESIYLLDHHLKVVHVGLSRALQPRSLDYHRIDFSTHVLFSEGVPLKGPSWGDAFVSMVTGEPTVSLGLPVPQGTLLGNISLMQLSRFLGLSSQGSRSVFAILDRHGSLLAHSEEGLAKLRINLGDHSVVRSAIGGVGKTARYREGDLTLIESAAPIPLTGWVVLVQTDLGVVMAPMYQLRNLLIAFMILGILFAAGAALRNARRLLRPLKDLGARVDRVGQGHYDFVYKPSGFMEIDRLAQRISDMADEIDLREASIKDSEKRFKTLVNSVDGIVWERDYTTRRFRFVSGQATDLIGYPLSSWMDESFWESLIHTEDRDRTIRFFNMKTEQKKEFDCEYRITAAGGRTIWVRDLVRVVTEDGQPKSLLGIMIDITRSKQVEQELMTYRQQLEDLVEQRTRALEKAQQELLQKERLAVLGQLTATVSHEIRNPLGTVANALYLIRESADSSVLSQLETPLSLAERNIARCDGIISELLDFSKQRAVRKIPLNLDAWLSSVLDEMFWPSGVTPVIDLNADMVINFDPDRLRRALINAINNAVQALEELDQGKQPVLTLMTRHADPWCEILVRDNGPGMSDDVLAQIFEPMFSTKNFGVGLGVPVIRNIVEDHGGSLHYDSREGEGTTVTMRLPVSDD